MIEAKMIKFDYEESAHTCTSLLTSIIGAKQREFYDEILKMACGGNPTHQDICNFMVTPKDKVQYYGKEIGKIKTELCYPDNITGNYSYRWTFIPS